MPAKDGPGLPETFFAPADRAPLDRLAGSIALAGSHPVIGALLETVQGLLAVLNEQRQVIALNEAYLSFLGIEEPREALGLRPGEVVECVHAQDHPGGCGTSRVCASCGAAIAIVTSLVDERPVERECVLTTTRGGRRADLDFVVRASPLRIGEEKLVLLYMHDITAHKRRASLERAFFHDVNNIVFAINGMAQVLEKADGERRTEMLSHLGHLSERLRKEVQLQRLLAHSEAGQLPVTLAAVTVGEVAADAVKMFEHHPAAEGRELSVSCEDPGFLLETDGVLLMRVLGNMLMNAFEATEQGGEVRLEARMKEDGVSFEVWNRGSIPPEVAGRVFQRYYSTKTGLARGQGTFILKLLGEQYLGGKVEFSSSEKEGTRFSLWLPAPPSVA